MHSQLALNQQTIIRHFNRAAPTYDQTAALAQAIGQQMLQRMELIRAQPQTILDLGGGTGQFTRQLRQRYPKAEVINADIAPRMLAVSQKKSGWFKRPQHICAAAEQLPLVNQSIDFVFANLTLEWCIHLEQALTEIKRVLKPNGLFMFSTLGPDTLTELRQCWQQVDTHLHVHAFLDMHDLGDKLIQLHFMDPVLDIEYFTLTYTTAEQLMQELKQTGSSNALTQQTAALTAKNKLQQCINYYEKFRNAQNLLPATFEVVYGHAWQKPAALSQPQTNGEVLIALRDIKVRR